MEELLNTFPSNLFQNFLAADVSLLHHVDEELRRGFLEQKSSGVIFRKVLPKVIDNVIMPIDGWDFHYLI